MKDHLHATDSAAVYYPEKSRSMVNMSSTCPDFSMVFKELFSLAALNLAYQIHRPLEALGRLFDEPLETGRQPRKTRLPGFRRSSDVESTLVDMEKDNILRFLSAGKFLFVTRQVSKTDVAVFGAAGFRFAPITQISNALSKTMELPSDELTARLQHMRTQTVSEKLMPPGVHLACFMLRPRLHQGFDILVPGKSRNQLPAVKLPYDELTDQQAEVLRRLDGHTVAQMFERLQGSTGLRSKIEVEFCRDFLRALTQLVRQIDDPKILQAKFSACAVEAPCQPQSHFDTASKPCSLLSIHMISTIYTPSPKRDFIFIPFRSFTVQQQVYMGVADQEAFARQAVLEFAHCFEPGEDENKRNSDHSSRVPILSSQAPDSPRSCQWSKGSLQRSIDEARGSGSTAEKLVNSASGAIIVSNDVTVDITDTLKPAEKAGEAQNETGSTGGASAAVVETETYVDKLFALCRG